jgi:hypothetical protein
MTVITPVGGVIGPRPTGASFRTGVWKQQEVFERRVDGVWATPAYPDLAPYSTNASGHILVATYNPGTKATAGPNRSTNEYVKARAKYPGSGLVLDAGRFAWLYTQAVTNSFNWRFDLRYSDEPDGSNVFGRTVQTGNLKRICAGNSCWNFGSAGQGFSIDYHEPAWPGSGYRYLWHDETANCNVEGVDYNIIVADVGVFRYITCTIGGPSSSRWPFDKATQNEYVYFNGNTQWYDDSQPNRAISMWLLPP